MASAALLSALTIGAELSLEAVSEISVALAAAFGLDAVLLVFFAVVVVAFLVVAVFLGFSASSELTAEAPSSLASFASLPSTTAGAFFFATDLGFLASFGASAVSALMSELSVFVDSCLA